jgi:pyridoxine 5-phosphate synthase
MTVLSVNLNKVALLRNQRDLTYPSLPVVARMAIAAGAEGITVHPRPDERHIRGSDVHELGQMLTSEYAGSVEFNIEGYPTEEFMALVEDICPEQVTLVPDSPEQSTSDHGWDIPAHDAFLRQVISRLKGCGARLALFVDDDPTMAGPAKDVGADRVELYTGPYHHAFANGRAAESIESFARAATAMRDAGLDLNAGHDLNLENLPQFLNTIPEIEEVSIGHALTVDALIMGMDAAVRAYVEVLRHATGDIQPQRLSSSR